MFAYYQFWNTCLVIRISQIWKPFIRYHLKEASLYNLTTFHFSGPSQKLRQWIKLIHDLIKQDLVIRCMGQEHSLKLRQDLSLGPALGLDNLWRNLMTPSVTLTPRETLKHLQVNSTLVSFSEALVLASPSNLLIDPFIQTTCP